MSDVAAFFVCAACGIVGGAGYEPFFALRAAESERINLIKYK